MDVGAFADKILEEVDFCLHLDGVVERREAVSVDGVHVGAARDQEAHGFAMTALS